MDRRLKVVRWGNSLAIGLPADLVRELDLKVGDYVGYDPLAMIWTKARTRREITSTAHSAEP